MEKLSTKVEDLRIHRNNAKALLRCLKGHDVLEELRRNAIANKK